MHNYLIEHISERITIETLSREFLMNTTTLKTVFKKVYGTTIAAHMKQHRMELAAGLLLKTQNDIASVAQAVGYESQSDLRRRLRRPTASCNGIQTAARVRGKEAGVRDVYVLDVYETVRSLF